MSKPREHPIQKRINYCLKLLADKQIRYLDKNMKKIILTAIIAVFTTNLYAQHESAEQETTFSVSPETVHPGDNITITLNPKLSLLNKSDDIKGVVYFWRDYHW